MLLLSLILVCTLITGNAEKNKLWNLSLDMTVDEAYKYLTDEKGIVVKKVLDGMGVITENDIPIMGYNCSVGFYKTDNNAWISVYFGRIDYDFNKQYKTLIPELVDKYGFPNDAFITLYSDFEQEWKSSSSKKQQHCRVEKISFNSIEELENFDIKDYAEQWEHKTENTEVVVKLLIDNLIIAQSFCFYQETTTLDLTFYKGSMKITAEMGDFTRNITTYTDTGF